VTNTTQSPCAYTITSERVSVFVDGRFRGFLLSSAQGKKLVEALKNGADMDEIRLLADVAAYVAARSFGRVELDDRDRLRLDGHVVDYGLAPVIKRMVEGGFSVEPLVNFVQNVALNPNTSVAEDLYRFIEKGDLPITPDGCFMAFKRVRDDYMDFHSGTVSYAVGAKPSMPRENCDEDRNVTCSRGLHACSFDYLGNFHGGRGKVVGVKINPRDVTAIPNDYNDTKLRCCDMEVVSEIPHDEVAKYYTSAVDRRFTPETGTEVPDATAADGVVSNAPMEAPRDWEAEGATEGGIDGRADFENGYDFDPKVVFPLEIAPQNRAAFSRGYFAGYETGWTTAKAEWPDMDGVEGVDDAPMSPVVAQTLGARDGKNDGVTEANNGSAFDPDPTYGENHGRVEDEGDDEAMEAYRMAYVEAYTDAYKAAKGAHS
jgi:hypothetical protein